MKYIFWNVNNMQIMKLEGLLQIILIIIEIKSNCLVFLFFWETLFLIMLFLHNI